MRTTPERLFVATPTEVIEFAISGGLDKAMDVLDAAGIMNERATSLVVAAERQGMDPVAFAHKLVMAVSIVSER